MGRKGCQEKQKIEGISVFVRVRPISVNEEAEGDEQVVDVNQGGTCLSVRNDERPHKAVQCTFDRVFNPNSTQEDVFNGLIPALDTVLEGYNACVLAYGQTGTGKTHTLIGPGGGTKLSDLPEDWGVIPRAVQFLFDRLAAAAEEDETFVYSVTCSFLQIYNENIVDLLQDRVHCDGSSLQIREESAACGGGHRSSSRQRRCNSKQSDAEGGWCSGSRGGRRIGALNENRRVFVNGLSSFRVGGAQDVLRYINIGATSRRVRATQYNEASSRSHAVMQLMVEAESSGGAGSGGGTVTQIPVSASGEHVTYRQAKLSLVDLAGSEKMNSALNITKAHFNELRSINQSLSALGNVVSALSEKHRTHVPYRDSKLTRLLQDSLGGNTRTTIIACVSPLAMQRSETVSTLQFADRAKKVIVRLRPNEVVDDRVLLARAQAEIVRLKQLLWQALDNTLRGDTVNAERMETMEEPLVVHQSARQVAEKSTDIEDEKQSIAFSAKNLANSKEVLREAVDNSVVPKDRNLDGMGGTAETVGTTLPSATTANKRQLARLVAQNENLREENDRLKDEIQGLVVQEQQRQKQKKRHRRGQSPSRLSSLVGGVSFPFPIDWSARYADAADAARRRRTPVSRPRSSAPESRRRAPSRTESASPSTRDTLLTSVSASIPRFRRREFDADYNHDEREAEVVPQEAIDTSAEQLRDTLGHNKDEEEQEKGERSDLKKEEEKDDLDAAKRIEWFRFELGKLAAGTFEGKETNGVTQRPHPTREGETVAHEVEKAQRLEDILFEAEGQERQRVREEMARLTAARAERLALEAQLASLTTVTTGGSGEALANLKTVASPPIQVMGTIKSSTVDRTPGGRCFSQRTPVCGRAPLADVEASTAPDRSVGGKIEYQTDQYCSDEPAKSGSAGAAVTPVVTATRIPPDQSVIKNTPPGIQRRSTIAPSGVSRALRTVWTTPPPGPQRSPSRRRPMTSAGTAAARTRSWRSQRGRRSKSRSPVRATDARYDPDRSNKVRQTSLEGQRPPDRGHPASFGGRSNGNASASTSSMHGYSEAKLAALQTAYPSSPLSSVGISPLLPCKKNRSPTAAVVDRNGGYAELSNDFIERENRCGSGINDRTGTGAQSGTRPRLKLTYSVADRGLRITVYSFRYDHYYECQVIGYDARRRMHRCAYDATGEKQWHDLRTKRFEVVGQNGVILRSTESAPESASTPLLQASTSQ